MTAGVKDFDDVEQGTTLRRPLIWRDSTRKRVELEGFTMRMQVRPSIDSEEVVLEFTSEEVAEEDQVEGVLYGSILLGATDDLNTDESTTGLITLYADDETMAAVPAGSYKYDLEYDGGDVGKLLKGKFKVVPEVTR